MSDPHVHYLLLCLFFSWSRLTFLIRFLRVILRAVIISWSLSGHVSWGNQQLEELLEASWSNWAASIPFSLFQGPQSILQLYHLTHFIIVLSLHISPFHWTELLEGRKMSLSELGSQGVHQALDLLPCVSRHCLPGNNFLFLQYSVSHTRGRGYVGGRSFHAFILRVLSQLFRCPFYLTKWKDVVNHQDEYISNPDPLR